MIATDPSSSSSDLPSSISAGGVSEGPTPTAHRSRPSSEFSMIKSHPTNNLPPVTVAPIHVERKTYQTKGG